MELIIDVEYREITELEEKSTELLTAEANSLYSQAEAVANVSMGLLIQAGERLVAIKQRIDHGGWEDWCSENLAFSKSKAERMMRLAKKAREEGSIFSNPSTLTDIGISKVWALLSAPEEVAYVNGFIGKEKLLESAKAYGKSPYGEHLKAVAEGKVRY